MTKSIRKLFSRGMLIGLVLTVVGCTTTIPPRIEVRDVASGRIYNTYQPWGKVTKGVGYEFTDIETGARITLTNYEVRTLEAQKSVGTDTPDARAFKEATARGGIKN